LRFIDAATGDLETVTDDTVLAFFWSPDGQYLAYFTPVRARGDGVARAGDEFYAQTGNILFDVLVVDVATLESRYLYSFTPTQVFVGQFLPFFDQYALSHRVWSPDSDALALSVVEDGRAQGAVVPLDGSPRLIAEGTMPFWRHD
jgi:TolB protein